MISPILQKKLEDSRKRFEAMLSEIASMPPCEERTALAYRAIHVACNAGHGYFSSDVLEKVFTDQAKSIHCKLSDTYDPNTCLIVLSVAYTTGGHTRVVERWIEEDVDRHYSVVLVKQGHETIPPRLISAVKNSQGTLVVFPDDWTDIQRATELRKMSSKFESVVLHTHMNDAVPLIAYGTEEFTRPVGLYNHADHRFWLGLSVADLVAELRLWGQKITFERRGLEESFLLTIPSDCKEIDIKPKADVRHKLGIPENVKLVLTVGASEKYRPLLGVDFLDLARLLLDARQDIVVLGIGMTMKEYPTWAKVSAQYGGRLKAIGYVDHDLLYDWYFAADLVLDSRPTSGETALTDASQCRCPILTTEMDNLVGAMEWTNNSPALCKDNPALVEKALKILDDPGFAKAHVTAVLEAQKKYNSKESFQRLLKDYFSKLLSLKHKVHPFSPKFNGFADIDAYHYIMSEKIKMKTNCGFLYKRYTKDDAYTRQKIIEIFGKKFVRKCIALGDTNGAL